MARARRCAEFHAPVGSTHRFDLCRLERKLIAVTGATSGTSEGTESPRITRE
jgi:hypothetical protein